MASWREAKLDENANFTLLPAEPEVILDIPFAIWAGSQSTPEKQEAAAEFRDFLLSQNQQTVLSDYGLDPAVDQTGVQADGETADRLQSWAARVLR